MARICVIDTTTNKCINVFDEIYEGQWFDHHVWVKAPRDDGEIGWMLLENGEWDTGIVPPTEEDIQQRERDRRNKYLSYSDKYAIVDYPISAEEREQWLAYRQALRDVTSQAGFPHNIEWPTPPRPLF